MGDSKILELAKKLKALADRGIGGEKTNALLALQKLCKKHNIDASTLELQIREQRRFTVPENMEVLFVHVADLVMGHDVKIFNLVKNKKIKLIDMSDAEFLEMEYCLHHYKRLYKEELKVFTTAFMVANRIWNPTRPEKSDEQIELTPDQRRALMMAEGIKRETYKKQLNSGK